MRSWDWRIAPERFRKLAVYDNPGRIAAFRDGSIWRMVIVVYALELAEEPEMHISKESKGPSLFQPGGNRGHPNRNHPQGYREGLVLQRGTPAFVNKQKRIYNY